MACQVVEGPDDATGRGVVPLKHKRVHLSSDLQVSHANTSLVLATTTTTTTATITTQKQNNSNN